MLLKEFADTLSSDAPDIYATLDLSDLTRLVTLSAEVLALTDGSWKLSPQSEEVVPFLRSALKLSLPTNDCNRLWKTLFPILSQSRVEPKLLVQQYGYDPELPVQIPEVFLTPPVKNCIVCPTSNNLQHWSSIDGYLYNVDGVHTARIFTKKCPNCTTYYRPSYYSCNGLRTYYSALDGRNKDSYQISCHFFMTHRLAEMFRNGQMLAHISYFNLANLFNLTYVDNVSIPTLNGAPKVQPFLSAVTCGDGLDIHSLLQRADSSESNLCVDGKVQRDQQYHDPMELVLEWIALEGSKHRDHVCSACVRVVPIPGDESDTPKVGYIRAVVTDGVTIGHWRCSATSDQLRELAVTNGLPPPKGPCTNCLTRVTDRFCPEHHHWLGKRCLAQPCNNDAVEGKSTCSLEEHVAAYTRFKARVTSNFALTSMLNRPGSNRPADPTVHQDWNTAELVGLEDVQQADEDDRAHEQAREGGDLPKTKGSQVCLSRKKTHNEQLAVDPCGIVLARETFYNAESVSVVCEFLLRTFPNRLPQVCFYDNACRLVEHIYHGREEHFKPFLKTVFPVDPFHFRSHKDTDEFCQHYTDPKLFPELREDGEWIFNSSAAEMTNVWYGGFSSIARNMSATRFNFFMEEMVERRNNWLLRRLEKRDHITFIGTLGL